MKKMAMVVAFTMVCGLVHAQTAQTSKEDLEKQILTLQNQLETQKQLEVKRFDGLGKEVGTIMQSLVATLDGAATVSIDKVNEFCETKAGKAAMIMVIWKYIGKDVVNFVWDKVVAILLLITFFIWAKIGAFRIFFGYRRKIGKDTWEDVESMSKDKDVSEDSMVMVVILYVVGGACLLIPALIKLF